MSPAQWEELASALSRHAKKVVARKKWAGSNPLGTGAACEDFVYDVINKVISGERPWSLASSHTLRQHLFQCIRSEVDNLSKRKDNANRDEFDGDGEASPEMALPQSPEKLLLQKQWAEEIEGELYVAAEEDPLLKKLVDLLMDGYETPAEFAATLTVPVDEINVALRKLRRRLQSRDSQAKIARAT